MNSKKYYKNIDIIRVIACISILLYHLNILKGGYLAVCTFFVLSGYLSFVSLYKKEKISLKEYYVNKLKRIYLPLIIVVFISVLAISSLSNNTWLNLKPETTSVLLGYNNFWQLNANLDYFARHINSPFMHFWYISILLQFDLLFPLLYLILKKLENKVNKKLPFIITTVLSIILTIYFLISTKNENIMITYYNTLTRLFSLAFGVTLGVIHSYYSNLVPSKLKNKKNSKIIFYVYLLLLIILFILIDAKSVYFKVAMVLSTIITCRLIDYGTLENGSNSNCFDKLIKSLSSVSYEIYLIQYPIIYLIQTTNNNIRISLIIILTLVLSYILHFSITNKNPKYKIMKYILLFIILIMTVLGGYKYIQAKDYTNDMKKLEDQLSKNQEILKQKQQEYVSKIKEEQDKWQDIISNIENGEKELEKMVKELPVVGIGDSVMLNATPSLYQIFPNGYFDAEVSRTAWVVNDIIYNLKNKNILGEPIILNLGANGDCSLECKIEIIDNCENREIFWLNTTNAPYYNNELASFASNYNNIHVIDWYNISYGHPEYFIPDGIHLTNIGVEAYTKTIYDEIYKLYLNKYKEESEKIIKEQEELLKNKITFYGNDILLNSFDNIQSNFRDANFIIHKDFTYKMLENDIKSSIKNDTLTKTMVFAFDSNLQLSIKEYEKIIDLCKSDNIYILTINNGIKDQLSNFSNVQIIDFTEEIKNHNYLMPDGIHLTEEGNKSLSNKINKIVKNK